MASAIQTSVNERPQAGLAGTRANARDIYCVTAKAAEDIPFGSIVVQDPTTKSYLRAVAGNLPETAVVFGVALRSQYTERCEDDLIKADAMFTVGRTGNFFALASGAAAPVFGTAATVEIAGAERGAVNAGGTPIPGATLVNDPRTVDGSLVIELELK